MISPSHGVSLVNVKEQQDIIAGWEQLNPEAMVVECMAINPKYQEWAEKALIQAHIGVITNVREDHQEVMGVTLAEIAHSLAHMCPTNGYLITAESNPELLAILQREAYQRNTRSIVVNPEWVSDNEICMFNYLSFKENIAIGLAVAGLLGIDRETAMRGMVKAKGDIGVLRLQQVSLHDKPVIWQTYSP